MPGGQVIPGRAVLFASELEGKTVMHYIAYMYKTFRKIATVEAKLFEPGDEDGLTSTRDMAVPKALLDTVTDPDLPIPYLTTIESQRHFGLFGRYYVCKGIDGERWLVEKDIFERTYEEVK
jgi:hypothetical protein